MVSTTEILVICSVVLMVVLGRVMRPRRGVRRRFHHGDSSTFSMVDTSATDMTTSVHHGVHSHVDHSHAHSCDFGSSHGGSDFGGGHCGGGHH